MAKNRKKSCTAAMKKRADNLVRSRTGRRIVCPVDRAHALRELQKKDRLREVYGDRLDDPEFSLRPDVRHPSGIAVLAKDVGDGKVMFTVRYFTFFSVGECQEDRSGKLLAFWIPMLSRYVIYRYCEDDSGVPDGLERVHDVASYAEMIGIIANQELPSPPPATRARASAPRSPR